MTRPPPTSTLFPYTTLFRSTFAAAQTTGIGNYINPMRAANAANHDTGEKILLRDVTLPRNQTALKDLNDGLRSEEHTSELQSLRHLVCRLLLEKKKQKHNT